MKQKEWFKIKWKQIERERICYTNLPKRKVWFVLVSLFNGISTFMGYLMPKPFI